MASNQHNYNNRINNSDRVDAAIAQKLAEKLKQKEKQQKCSKPSLQPRKDQAQASVSDEKLR